MTCAEMQLCVEVVPIPTSVWRFPNVWKKGLTYEIKRRVRSFLFNTLDQNRAYKLLRYLNNKYKLYVKKKEQEAIANEKSTVERKVQEAIFQHEIEIQRQREEREMELKRKIMIAKEIDNERKTVMAKFIEEQQRELAALSVIKRNVENETCVVDDQCLKTDEIFIEDNESQVDKSPLFPLDGLMKVEEESFPSFSSYIPEPLNIKTEKQIRVESAMAAIDTKTRLRLPATVYSQAYIEKAGCRPYYKLEEEKYYYRGGGVWRSGENELFLPSPLIRTPGPIIVKPKINNNYLVKDQVSDAINYNDYLDQETRQSSNILSRSILYDELSSDDDSMRDDTRIIYASEDDDSQLLSDTDDEVSDHLLDIDLDTYVGPKVIYADSSDSDSQYLSE